MVSIAVCDDNILECSAIAAKIKEILNETNTPCAVHQYNSGRELLEAPLQFDIVFLDIIMKELNGMKTAEIFRRSAYDRILIFISASREYVFDAYDMEAFQYLVKPVEDKKLRKALERAVAKTDNDSREYIVVSKERQRVKLFLRDIYYFEIRGRVIYAHGTEGVFGYYEQIGVLENSLLGKGFFRCHKSYLINLKYVDIYNRQEVTLDNGEKIMIARRRYQDFCEEILAYMRKNGGIL